MKMIKNENNTTINIETSSGIGYQTVQLLTFLCSFFVNVLSIHFISDGRGYQ